MEIIRLEVEKEYCDKHNVRRNDWVAGAVHELLGGDSVVKYRNKNNHLVTIDLEYIHSHMQSMKGFDDALHSFMISSDRTALNELQYMQLRSTIGELADDWEIGK